MSTKRDPSNGERFCRWGHLRCSPLVFDFSPKTRSVFPAGSDWAYPDQAISIYLRDLYLMRSIFGRSTCKQIGAVPPSSLRWASHTGPPPGLPLPETWLHQFKSRLPWRSQEEPGGGGARRRQEQPGGARGSQEGPNHGRFRRIAERSKKEISSDEISPLED